jgi:cold shock protein
MGEDKTVQYGEIIWFSAPRGIGFLRWEKEGVKQKDMFIHYSDIVCSGFKTLFKQRKVSFQIGTNNHGDPKAINVTVLKN